MDLISIFFPEKNIILNKKSEECLEYFSKNLYPNRFIQEEFLFLLPYRKKDFKNALFIFKKRPQKKLLYVFTTLAHEAIFEYFQEEIIFKKIKLNIVPVPKYKTFFHNPYNPSEFLAKEIAKKLKAKYLPTLKKIKRTKKQAQLQRKERLNNLKNTFFCTKKLDSKEYFVIIDDVMTTGATIKEAKRALKKSGAKNIISLTIFH